MFRYRRHDAGLLRAVDLVFATLILLIVAAGSASAGFSDAFEKYIARDYTAARAAAEPDAQRGNPAAQWLLGTMYLLGEGVDEDPELARDWFEKSASSNYPPSQALLGRMFEEGIGGGQDASYSHTLRRLSAGQG